MRIREVRASDIQVVADIFNYFVLETYAAYPVDKVEPDRFELLIKSASVFLVVEVNAEIIGFGFLKPFRETSTFRHTGVLTYFILPHYTRSGLGTKLLKHLISEAKKRSINNLVAHISSKNTQSLRFHEKHGFKQVGCLERMGTKFDQSFDIVWVQKFL